MGGFSHLSFFDELNGIGSTTYACRTQITNDGGDTWTAYLSDTGQPVNLALALNDSDAVAFRWGPALSFSYPAGQLLQEPDVEVFGDLDILCPIGPNVCLYNITGSLDTISVNAGSNTWSLTSNDRLATFASGAITYNYFGSGITAEVIAGDTIVLVTYWNSFLTGPNLTISFDKGVSWNAPRPYPFNPLENIGMHWLNSNRCIASGPDGIIGRTFDGGLQWDSIPTPTTEHLNDIHFINDLQGWAVGENGTIIASIDGGQSWFLEESGVTDHLNAIASDDQAVIIIGHNGVILRRDLTVSIASGTIAPNTSISVLDREGNILIRSEVPIESVQLFDAMGRLLIGSIANGTSIQIQSPAKGISICRVQLSDGRSIDQRVFIP